MAEREAYYYCSHHPRCVPATLQARPFHYDVRNLLCFCVLHATACKRRLETARRRSTRCARAALSSQLYARPHGNHGKSRVTRSQLHAGAEPTGVWSRKRQGIGIRPARSCLKHPRVPVDRPSFTSTCDVPSRRRATCERDASSLSAYSHLGGVLHVERATASTSHHRGGWEAIASRGRWPASTYAGAPDATCSPSHVARRASSYRCLFLRHPSSTRSHRLTRACA